MHNDSALHTDRSLYCAYFGGPRDGFRSGDMPPELSGKKLTGTVARIPLSQPPEFSIFAVYKCTSETQIGGSWEFHFQGLEGPQGEQLVAKRPTAKAPLAAVDCADALAAPGLSRAGSTRLEDEPS